MVNDTISIWLITIIPVMLYGFFEIEFLRINYRWIILGIYAMSLWVIVIYNILA